MNGLLIIGAGGHGKVVADAALSAGWGRIAFLDDRAATLSSALGLPVLGTLDDLPSLPGEYHHAVVAIGGAPLRMELTGRCTQIGFEVVSIVHPGASVSRFATLGRGSVVFAQAAINADASLGTACIVNTGATVDHDCRIGDAVHICPGAHLAGNVRVGDRAWIGIGASTRQGVVIGTNAMVGAGAVVVTDVPHEATVVGVPAKQRKEST